MEPIRISIAGFWTATMLIYLLGDVLRIYSGDMTIGAIDGKPATQAMWLGIAIIMLIPILMVPLTLILPLTLAKWLNLIIVPMIILFNLLGMPYKGHYDNFLLIVSFLINAIVFFYAWSWK